LIVTFAASLGMSLPISTPPNALAHATGNVQTNHMAKVGVVLGVVGVALSFVMVWILNIVGYIQ
jgi:sodium-dependent dicarboxylate transporter 2/3/5